MTSAKATYALSIPTAVLLSATVPVTGTYPPLAGVCSSAVPRAAAFGAGAVPPELVRPPQ